MALTLILDVIVVVWIAAVIISKGFEAALPVAAFLFPLFPAGAQFHIPGLFGLTTQRVIVLVLMTAWITTGRSGAKSPVRGGLPLRGPILLLIVWMTIASLHSIVPVVSIKATLSQFFDFFVVYVIYVKSISRKETVERILYGFVGGMLVCSVLGFVEDRAGWSVASLFPAVPTLITGVDGITNERGVRIQSTFDHAILFGAALAMCIPLAMYLLTKARTRARKAILWAAFVLMLYCTYKTQSRGPWLALAIALAAVALLGSAPMRKYVAVLLIASAAVFVANSGVAQSLSSIYVSTKNPDSQEGQSYDWRYMLYSLAQKELGKSGNRALLGYGPESFYYLHLTAPFMVDGVEHMVPVESCDSAVVEIMMGSGYVGLLLVVLLLGRVAWTAFREYLREPRAQRTLPLVLLTSLGVFCFMMTNVEIWEWGQQNYMLWIIAACIMVLPHLAREAREAGSKDFQSKQMEPVAV